MDGGINVCRQRLPVTLALACALEDAGDLFAAARAIAKSGLADRDMRPVGKLLCDMIAPLVEMGAFYTDKQGIKKIDREAICDFAIVGCGLTRHATLYDLTLHELALHHRRVTPRAVQVAAPSAAFLAEMQELFPDDKGYQP